MKNVKNWFNLTTSPSLYCRYAYFDLEDHLADSLFERRHVPVRYEREFQNQINGYRLIICKVLPWHREGFRHGSGPDRRGHVRGRRGRHSRCLVERLDPRGNPWV